MGFIPISVRLPTIFVIQNLHKWRRLERSGQDQTKTRHEQRADMNKQTKTRHKEAKQLTTIMAEKCVGKSLHT